MGKDIQIFNNDKFGQLRTVIIDNEPWFVGKDVADTLGYQKRRKTPSFSYGDIRRVLRSPRRAEGGQYL